MIIYFLYLPTRYGAQGYLHSIFPARTVDELFYLIGFVCVFREFMDLCNAVSHRTSTSQAVKDGR